MVNIAQQRIRIFLTGRFRIEGPNGEDLTPIGVKACGLLALLATDSNLGRSRVWLQDKLWSDRAAPQAGASLRQALVEIRKSFGDQKACLQSTRHSISLDVSRIEVVQQDSNQFGQSEFLEGLDVKDPEFEDWLRQTRAFEASRLKKPNYTGQTLRSTPFIHRADASFRPTNARKIVVLEAQRQSTGSLRDKENKFIDVIYRSLSELYSIDIKFHIPEDPSDDLLLVSVQAFEECGGKTGLRIIISDGIAGAVLFSEVFYLADQSDQLEAIGLYSFANQVMTIVSNAICASPTIQISKRSSGHLAALAMRKMFSMHHDELEIADRLLDTAMQREEKAIFYALKAQSAAIRYIEQTGNNFADLKQISQECCAKALSLEPYNSSVLSSVANALLVFENDQVSCMELSRISVRANPANPFAWWANSNANLYAGENERAYEAACMSQKIAARSNFRFWSDFQVSLTAAITGRTDVAINFGRVSSALAPRFRPPLRYLTAIYANEGDQSAASQTAKKLRNIEETFSIDALVNDEMYPASLIRKAKLVDDPSCLFDIEI